MNERIAKLAEQAEEYSYTEYAKKQTGYTREDFFRIKFAELIKQEIYNDVAEDLTPDELVNIEPDSFNRQYLKGCNGGTTDALYRIKMFGVDMEEE